MSDVLIRILNTNNPIQNTITLCIDRVQLISLLIEIIVLDGYSGSCSWCFGCGCVLLVSAVSDVVAGVRVGRGWCCSCGLCCSWGWGGGVKFWFMIVVLVQVCCRCCCVAWSTTTPTTAYHRSHIQPPQPQPTTDARTSPHNQNESPQSQPTNTTTAKGQIHSNDHNYNQNYDPLLLNNIYTRTWWCCHLIRRKWYFHWC